MEAVPPLAAHFFGPVRVRDLPGGLVESVRDVEILLPQSVEEGPKRGTIQLRWEQGDRRDRAITWDVTPCIRVSPTGLVLKPDTASRPHTVLLRAVDRPFRILDVAGPISAEAPIELTSDSKSLHMVALGLDPGRFEASGTADVTITTDHPDQPTVTVSVLVLPGGPGASP